MPVFQGTDEVGNFNGESTIEDIPAFLLKPWKCLLIR